MLYPEGQRSRVLCTNSPIKLRKWCPSFLLHDAFTASWKQQSSQQQPATSWRRGRCVGESPCQHPSATWTKITSHRTELNLSSIPFQTVKHLLIHFKVVRIILYWELFFELSLVFIHFSFYKTWSFSDKCFLLYLSTLIYKRKTIQLLTIKKKHNLYCFTVFFGWVTEINFVLQNML